MNQFSLTIKQAIIKAASYCSYQERCYKEVKEKLAEWGIYGTDAGEIMIELSQQNYLNEERFAKAFAGGKFRTKKWGKVKITRELKQRNISETNIRIALKEIENDEYLLRLNQLAVSKFESVKETNSLTKKNKTVQWLLSKGYEVSACWDAVNQL